MESYLHFKIHIQDDLFNQKIQLFVYKNTKMLGIAIFTTALVFVYSIQTETYGTLQAIIFSVNIVYAYKYCTKSNFTFDQMLKYLLHGQNLASLLFLGWICLFNKQTYVYFIPLFLSSSAKIYWLIAGQQSLNNDFLQENILFQAKTEIFILGYQILCVFYGGIFVFVELFLLFLILQLKYTLHEKTQQAYKQLHFSIDNMLKRTKFRSKYQKFIQILGLIGNNYGNYGGSKQIVY